MQTAELIFRIFLAACSIFIVVAVTMPIIRKDSWVFRIFDYPRLQKFVIAGGLIAGWLAVSGGSPQGWEWLALGSLSAAFIYLAILIFPFTPFGKKMIFKAESGQSNIKILVSNVYQDNAQYERLQRLIEDSDPDIFFLLETDSGWQKAMEKFKKEYPYSVEIPKDNTYGMLFFSRYEILQHSVGYLVEDEIPSIIADIKYDGQSIRIYGLHPTPPVPQENENSTERDAEILLIGKMAKQHSGPCIVMGDLNDVAWSYSTELFLKVSGLLDPRRGRGLYSTFNAHYRLLRWPLDHFFVSDHFHLAGMKVERHIGSDHFPISISLCLTCEKDGEKLESDAEDQELADDKIDAGMKHEPR